MTKTCKLPFCCTIRLPQWLAWQLMELTHEVRPWSTKKEISANIGKLVFFGI